MLRIGPANSFTSFPPCPSENKPFTCGNAPTLPSSPPAHTADTTSLAGQLVTARAETATDSPSGPDRLARDRELLFPERPAVPSELESAMLDGSLDDIRQALKTHGKTATADCRLKAEVLLGHWDNLSLIDQSGQPAWQTDKGLHNWLKHTGRPYYSRNGNPKVNRNCELHFANAPEQIIACRHLATHLVSNSEGKPGSWLSPYRSDTGVTSSVAADTDDMFVELVSKAEENHLIIDDEFDVFLHDQFTAMTTCQETTRKYLVHAFSHAMALHLERKPEGYTVSLFDPNATEVYARLHVRNLDELPTDFKQLLSFQNFFPSSGGALILQRIESPAKNPATFKPRSFTVHQRHPDATLPSAAQVMLHKTPYNVLFGSFASVSRLTKDADFHAMEGWLRDCAENCSDNPVALLRLSESVLERIDLNALLLHPSKALGCSHLDRLIKTNNRSMLERLLEELDNINASLHLSEQQIMACLANDLPLPKYVISEQRFKSFCDRFRRGKITLSHMKTLLARNTSWTAGNQKAFAAMTNQLIKRKSVRKLKLFQELPRSVLGRLDEQTVHKVRDIVANWHPWYKRLAAFLRLKRRQTTQKG
ncbi:ShET2/EspL2 family type III secretion system effector toxin [Paludibacterium paludis]|uniref:ShET2 enterotoxin N-terminal domain-containing protein n=1 Tax=Paludibacterium paludis TaxID=1225769 RepID=A0A918P0B1_9NEIS|nr:ShET2/EspL2 family type III secretion system effector toxin [Paludibacterium paludis]GGY09996.1 hypothetical protein GCM10011289_11130 [Paludibacterium paludis]